MEAPPMTIHPTKFGVRSVYATGVRFPRPCPFDGCPVEFASVRERDAHLVEHIVWKHGDVSPAARAKRARGPDASAVPSLLARSPA
jgi:hypothetical protein